jgi:hypothetical protein
MWHYGLTLSMFLCYKGIRCQKKKAIVNFLKYGIWLHNKGPLTMFEVKNKLVTWYVGRVSWKIKKLMKIELAKKNGIQES